MNFSIDKRGYSVNEVNDYIKKITREYEDALSEQKQRIVELKAALKESESSIKAYKEKSSLVTKAIYNAVAKAEEIEHLTQLKYNQEIEQLKAFHEKWMSYYNKILEKYPLDDDLLAASKFNHQMKNILAKTNSVKIQDDNSTKETLEKTFERETARLKEKRIGYISVQASEKDAVDDDKILEEMLPGGDMNSPILSGSFDPIERINRYLNSEKGKPELKEEAAAKSKVKDNYTDRSSSGFSFQEALNPKEDLAQIMKDLGLLLDNK